MKIMVYATAVASLCSILAFVPLFQACNNVVEQKTQLEIVESTDSGIDDVPPVTVHDAGILEVVKTEELDGGQRVQYIDISEKESYDVMNDVMNDVMKEE